MEIKTELQKRVVTGVLGGACLLGLIYFGRGIGVALFALAISLMMLKEFIGISVASSDQVSKSYFLFTLAWLIHFINFFIPQIEYGLLIFTFLLLFGYFLFAVKKSGEAGLSAQFHEGVVVFFGVIYLIFLPLFLTRLRELPSGAHWVAVSLMIVWAGDSAAYFAGRKWGKKKLFPEISPKKTQEGAYGGLIAGWVVCVLYKALVMREMSWLCAVVMPILVGISAILGDLCESFFKRAYSVKDSGAVLPGHGGFLDRFDGVVFSLPVAYACARLLS